MRSYDFFHDQGLTEFCRRRVLKPELSSPRTSEFSSQMVEKLTEQTMAENLIIVIWLEWYTVLFVTLLVAAGFFPPTFQK